MLSDQTIMPFFCSTGGYVWSPWLLDMILLYLCLDRHGPWYAPYLQHALHRIDSAAKAWPFLGREERHDRRHNNSQTRNCCSYFMDLQTLQAQAWQQQAAFKVQKSTLHTTKLENSQRNCVMGPSHVWSQRLAGLN